MKKEVDRISAVPSKRLFLSIIADYDLNRSICELIDNALDIWTKNGKNRQLLVIIDLNLDQQTIRVTDNAGGVKKDELPDIVGPGQTSNLPTDHVIGIFGVGSKRAVVALAQDIRITTRFENESTYRIEYDDEWLESEDWELPVYEVEEISKSTTIIDLHRLRFNIDQNSIDHLTKHVRSTYARFLDNASLSITICTEHMTPIIFDNWAYPPDYEPRKYYGKISTEEGDIVDVEVKAGLCKESSPIGEYGVYFYCNDRLIARALKSYEVGFATGIAGQPHPSLSLARIIISLQGQARSMPWNSSKSGISYQHKVFEALRDWLLHVIKDWTSLSRRLEGQWQEEVFRYKKGKIQEVFIESFPEAKKSYLPPLPKSKPRYIDRLKNENKIISKKKPWVLGLLESIIAVDLISKQKLTQKNRINFIILDSTLEIAFKEYLVNETEKKYTDEKLFKLFQNRYEVHNEMKDYVDFETETWDLIEYYYRLRCKLIHERGSVQISDEELEDYRELVEEVLDSLFGLNFDV